MIRVRRLSCQLSLRYDLAMRPALSAEEFAAWQAFESTAEAVLAAVERDVADAANLSAAEYRVLSCLDRLGRGQLRQRELALALRWDKSRTSHQLKRMQARKLLTRSKTQEKGSLVAITRLGRETLSAARPVHAASTRRHLLGRLTAEQLQAILEIGRIASGETSYEAAP